MPMVCCWLLRMPGRKRCDELSEISFEKAEWRIPAARMEMDWPHIVPLSKQALVIIYNLEKVAAENGRFMFPVVGLQLRGTPASETAHDGSLGRLSGSVAGSRACRHAQKEGRSDLSRFSRWMSRRSKPDSLDR
jgi:integrase